MVDLVSQYSNDSEALKIASAINTLIQYWSETLEPNFPERHNETQDM